MGFSLIVRWFWAPRRHRFESLYLVQQGKLTELTLTQRAGDAKPAIMQLIDARQQAWQNGLAQSLIKLIRQTLDKDEQVLVF